MGCGYFKHKTNHLKLTIDIQGIILYYPLYNERQEMNTETQVEIKKTELALMERINQMLSVMNIMQDNITELAERVVKLEKRDNGQR